MAVTRKNIVSLLIGFLLLGLLFHPIKEIPDVPHQSFFTGLNTKCGMNEM